MTRKDLMDSRQNVDIQKLNKDYLIDRLTDELTVLRTRIGLSQEELSKMIGISRQTYSSIETKKRRMSWNTFLSLILVFEVNKKTKELLELYEIVTPELKQAFNRE